MSPRLPLEDLATSPKERRLLKRVMLVVSAIALGAVVGVGSHAWAIGQNVVLSNRIDEVDAHIDKVEKRLDKHIDEVNILRPEMIQYRSDEMARSKVLNDKIDRLLEDCYRRGGCRLR